MRIRVEDIKAKPVILHVEEAAEEHPALAGLSESGECEFISPLVADLVCSQEYDHIRVEGKVGTKVRLHCSRCLEEFEKDVSASFTLYYNKTTGDSLEEEIELKEEDLLSAFYEGEYIDLSSEIEEQVIMEIPYKPLCNDDCQGLCGVCGKNLNEGDCGCEPEPSNFRFGVLKNFKVNK